MTASAWRYIALHSAAATAFGFLFARFMLGQSLEMSLLWAAFFGVAAAALAWHQSKR